MQSCPSWCMQAAYFAKGPGEWLGLFCARRRSAVSRMMRDSASPSLRCSSDTWRAGGRAVGRRYGVDVQLCRKRKGLVMHPPRGYTYAHMRLVSPRLLRSTL